MHDLTVRSTQARWRSCERGGTAADRCRHGSHGLSNLFDFDRFAPSHHSALKAAPHGITARIYDQRNGIQWSICTSKILGRTSRIRVKSDVLADPARCPFAPESGHGAGTPQCPLCAKGDRSAVQQKCPLFDQLSGARTAGAANDGRSRSRSTSSAAPNRLTDAPIRGPFGSVRAGSQSTSTAGSLCLQ